jgi:hypothetical protein
MMGGVRWTKEALAARVDALGTGPELERFAAGLTDDERELLQEALLERSGAASYAFDERVRARGWLRRQWDRTDPFAGKKAR